MSVLSRAEKRQSLHSSSSSSSSSKEACIFYKLIVASILQDKKLKIPNKFVRKYGDELLAVATLVVPNGREWLVEIKRSAQMVWFHDGWHEFVEHHCIHVGHLLVFRYEGNSSFNVHMFSLTAFESYQCSAPIKLSDHIDSKQRPVTCSDEITYDNCTGIFGSSTLCTAYDSSRNKFFDNCLLDQDADNFQLNSTRDIAIQFDGNALSKATVDNYLNFSDEAREMTKRRRLKIEPKFTMIWGAVTNEEKQRAVHEADAFKPVNPFFRIIMKQSYIRGFALYIPSRFAEKHLNGVSGFITLQVSDGKQWPVRCIYEGPGARFSKGWLEFVLENKLNEADVCVFELIKTVEVVLRVTIFRVLEGRELMNKPVK